MGTTCSLGDSPVTRGSRIGLKQTNETCRGVVSEWTNPTTHRPNHEKKEYATPSPPSSGNHIADCGLSPGASARLQLYAHSKHATPGRSGCRSFPQCHRRRCG